MASKRKKSAAETAPPLAPSLPVRLVVREFVYDDKAKELTIFTTDHAQSFVIQESSLLSMLSLLGHDDVAPLEANLDLHLEALSVSVKLAARQSEIALETATRAVTSFDAMRITSRVLDKKRGRRGLLP